MCKQEDDVPLKGWLAANDVPSQLDPRLDSPQIFADSNPSPFMPARM